MWGSGGGHTPRTVRGVECVGEWRGHIYRTVVGGGGVGWWLTLICSFCRACVLARNFGGERLADCVLGGGELQRGP